ncbi:hypothetical protein, partial [Moorena sp. SIO3H5]|uniref:hypothetical protein n=1 Tax=Moorena sp. SIO3H5 TaxID=2607834 RepID=UPI0025DF1C7C
SSNRAVGRVCVLWEAKIKQPIDRIEAFNQSPMARNPRLPAATARVNNAVALGLTMALPKRCADYLVGWLTDKSIN